MRTAFCAVLFLSLGCGDEVSAGASDASSDTSDAHVDHAIDAAILVDAREAPLPGEIPPATSTPCPWSLCPAHASCNDTTGWCCNGTWISGECRCGATLGCSASEVCCPWSIHPYPHCVASDQCQ